MQRSRNRFFVLLLLLAATFLILWRVEAFGLPEEGSATLAKPSWILHLLEKKLSKPNRRVHFEGVSGALTAHPHIGLITLSDNKGIWMRFEDVHLRWNYWALLKGQVTIEALQVRHIQWLRPPLPPSGLPSAEAHGFSMPSLPLGIELESFEAPDVVLDEPVVGLEAHLALKATLSLLRHRYSTTVLVQRLDTLGKLALDASYQKDTQNLALKITGEEAPHGLMAHLMHLKKEPPMHIAVQGGGPLDQLHIGLSAYAGEEKVLEGQVRSAAASTAEEGKGTRFYTTLQGELDSLIPRAYKGFFGGKTDLSFQAFVPNRGGVTLEALSLKGQSITVEGQAKILSDGFLRRLQLKGRAQAAEGARLRLPMQEQRVEAKTIAIDIDYGAPGCQRWHATLQLEDFSHPKFFCDEGSWQMQGVCENLDQPQKRHITLDGQGNFSGLQAQNSLLNGLLKNGLHISLKGALQGREPLRVQEATLKAQNLVVWAKGFIDGHFLQQTSCFHGDIGLSSENLQPLGTLFHRNGDGSATLIGHGTLSLLTGAFQINFLQKDNQLTWKFAPEKGVPSSAQRFTLSGTVLRNSQGIFVKNFFFGNKATALTGNGELSSTLRDMDFGLILPDIHLLHKDLSGPLELHGNLSGHDDLYILTLDSALQEGSVRQKHLEKGRLYGDLLFDATDPLHPYVTGFLNGTAHFDTDSLSLCANFEKDNAANNVANFSLVSQKASLTGRLSRSFNKEWLGHIHMDAQDIETLAALFLFDAHGPLYATLTLEPHRTLLTRKTKSINPQSARFLTSYKQSQSLLLEAHTPHLETEKGKVQQLTLEASILDLFSFPKIEGSLQAKQIKLPGKPHLLFKKLTAQAFVQGLQTHFEGLGLVNNTARFAIKGVLSPRTMPRALSAAQPSSQHAQGKKNLDASSQTTGHRIDITSLQVDSAREHIQLLEPASLFLEEGALSTKFILSAEKGLLETQGHYREGALDFRIRARDFPLSLLNMVEPTLNMHGRLQGEAHITGTQLHPNLLFSSRVTGFSLTPLRAKALPPLNFSLQGKTGDAGLSLIGQGLYKKGQASLEGTIPFYNKAAEPLALTISSKGLPLSLFNGFTKPHLLGGVFDGLAHISGSLESPKIAFSLVAQKISSNLLLQQGVAPALITLQGTYLNHWLHLAHLKVQAGPSVHCVGQGDLDLQKLRLNLGLDGALPVSLANLLWAERGTKVKGIVQLHLQARGDVKNPDLQGRFALNNGQVMDAQTHLHFTNIKGNGIFTHNYAVVQKITGTPVGGGLAFGEGKFSLDAYQNFPVTLAVYARDMRYSDDRFFVARGNADLHMKGPLLNGATFSSTIFIKQADIQVPSKFHSLDPIVLRHKNSTPPIRNTLQRVDAVEDKEEKKHPHKHNFLLNIAIRAPRRIFVHGMGLNIEMGGKMQIFGSTREPKPMGELKMIHGFFDLLSKRITFDSGRITLMGDLNPHLDFVANSTEYETAIKVLLSGSIDSLKLDLKSQPALPKDEILAYLLFKRSIRQLSPFQMFELASIASQLAGLTDSNLLSVLRSNIGLSEFDIVTDKQGNTRLRAGQYIRENIYLGIDTGKGDATNGTVKIDLSKHFKLRGSLAIDGNSSVGVSFEHNFD